MERFVPESTSLTDDAPGWLPDTSRGSKEGRETNIYSSGPVCWKCRGSKRMRTNKAMKDGTSCACKVCNGLGQLPAKNSDVVSKKVPGKITRGRKLKATVGVGPPPYAHTLSELSRWTQLVIRATETCTDVLIGDEIQKRRSQSPPIWLPKNPGEELCNLVGRWRILQRVGSHRWTTDDLCTAYCAASSMSNTDSSAIQYLDLGTGNASVLQMTYWAIASTRMKSDDDFQIYATGVEARSEAVGLARRSIEYNIGPTNAKIIHADFRQLDQMMDKGEVFDLISGTPPYFRVDFHVNGDSDSATVTKAVIVEGGMPTAKQSAPARCEFRGGIEAYCQTAAKLLHSDHGKFVVCENFLNHSRTLKACQEAGLQIISQLNVLGRTGKPVLFAVYTMVKATPQPAMKSPIINTVAVRDDQGEWTDSYLRILVEMGIA